MNRTLGVALLIISLGFPVVAAAGSTGAVIAGTTAGFAGGLILSQSGLLGGGGGSGYNSAAADAMCDPVITQCPCGVVPDSHGKCTQRGTNWYMCPNYCKATVAGGVTIGHCVAKNVCHGDTFSKLGGGTSGTDAGLSQLGQMLGQLMGKLMQGGQGSGSGSTPASTAPTSSGCTTYYQSSVPSSDPCAYYVPNTSSLLTGSNSSNVNASGDLLSALGDTGSGSTGNISDLLTQGMSGTGIDISNTNTNVNNNTAASSSAATSTAGTSTVQLLPGLGRDGGAQGNIQVLPNGATIVANTVDTQGNTAVAGFYGTDSTLGSQQPQGLVAKLCQSRPWAGNVLSYVIPSSFFDGLCQWQGYQVGSTQTQAQTTQAAPQNVTLTQTKVPAGNASSTSASTVAPKVQIWAVPASVPLGARTSIEWTTQGVTNCTETSPDGSFSSNTLQGTAATVPLTGPTTYSISCQTQDGTPVTGYVTVNIAL